MRTEYKKLIRDKIPEMMDAAGVGYELTTLDGDAYHAALREKLVEEAMEVAQAPERGALIDELADVQEVLAALMAATGVTGAEVAAVQRQRRAERGGFERRLELVWTERAE
jgi:predicted house-cleaning noncanonical NTP pyrophosphatase (MazG superfamily)